MTALTKDGYIEFHLNSWMENAAICGLVSILKDDRSNIKINSQSVEVPVVELENFEEKYFSYFSEQYRKFSSLTKILAYQYEIDKHLANELIDFEYEDYIRLQDYIENILRKYGLSNSYLSVYQLVNSSFDIVSSIKKIKVKRLVQEEFVKKRKTVIRKVEKIYNELCEIFTYYNHKDVKRYLKAKTQIYSVINKAYDGVSFLNRAESKGDFYKKYHDYFIDSVFAYLDENYEKNKLTCTNCGRPVRKENISYSFINKTGYDVTRKTSNSWSFSNDVVMCPICRLMYTCIPAGFSYVYNKGIFVNETYSVKHLLEINTRLKQKILHSDETKIKTNAIYRTLIQELKLEMNQRKQGELQAIQIIRFVNERYYFDMLSRSASRVIHQSEIQMKSLQNAWYVSNEENHSLYQEMVDCLFNNKNLFALMYQALWMKMFMKEGYITKNHLLILAQMNTKILKEFDSREEADQLDEINLWKIRFEGKAFADAYSKISSENKVRAIALRLMNALHATDSEAFMNIVLHSYVNLEKAIPPFFYKCFLSDQCLKTVGYTFLVGMIKEKIEEDEGGK